MRISRTTVCCVMICLALPTVFRGQKTASECESLHAFVQGFYEWYVPKALSDSSVPPSETALKQRNSVFGPQLAAALREDHTAQAKFPGEIVGLDFDPFLNTQDPCDHYEVGTITQTGDVYFVNVFAVCSGKKSSVPDVVPELLHKGRRWEFINFHYPNQGKRYSNSADLLGILKIQREERRKPQK